MNQSASRLFHSVVRDRCHRSVFACLSAALVCAAGMLQADEEAPSHPAAKVVTDYLKAVVGQDWKDAAEHVALDALQRRQQQFVEAVQASPTIDIERARLEGLDVRDIEELRRMDPREFYQRERDAMHRPLNVTPATLDRKKNSLKVSFIAVVEDGDTVTHALVRTTQETLDTMIEEMLVLTLEKQADDAWRVVPDAQRPIITPLSSDE